MANKFEVLFQYIGEIYMVMFKYFESLLQFMFNSAVVDGKY